MIGETGLSPLGISQALRDPKINYDSTSLGGRTLSYAQGFSPANLTGLARTTFFSTVLRAVQIFYGQIM